MELVTTCPCSCKRLPCHSCGVGHHLIDMLVVLGALAQGRPQQPGEGEHQDHRGDTYFHISMCHKDFRERDAFRIARLPARCKEQARKSSCGQTSRDAGSDRLATAIGRPTTFEYDPSIRGMNRDASP